jgi:hypothetical protein
MVGGILTISCFPRVIPESLPRTGHRRLFGLGGRRFLLLVTGFDCEWAAGDHRGGEQSTFPQQEGQPHDHGKHGRHRGHAGPQGYQAAGARAGSFLFQPVVQPPFQVAGRGAGRQFLNDLDGLLDAFQLRSAPLAFRDVLLHLAAFLSGQFPVQVFGYAFLCLFALHFIFRPD